MSKSARLNQELIFLSSKKYFNLTDLMKEFNISKRTALRDIQTLETMGLSFYVENGRYGGYQLLKQNLLTPIYFDNAEITSIFFALKALNLLSSTPFEKSYPQIYQKLFATLSKEQQQYINKLLEAVDYHNIPPINSTPFLNMILDSILELRILNVQYNQYESLNKDLQFYNLFYRNGVWFANAYDIDKKIWGIYRCDCIENCVLSTNKNIISRRELKISLKNYEENYKNINFKCKINSFGKEIFLKNNYPNMQLKKIKNDYYIVGSFNKSELNYMVHYLIGFGKNIMVESPKLLKDSYLNELKKIIKTYK